MAKQAHDPGHKKARKRETESRESAITPSVLRRYARRLVNAGICNPTILDSAIKPHERENNQ